MKKKLLIAVPVLVIVIVAIAGYAFLMPKKASAKPHLLGDVVNLPGSFTLNLAGGHYATVSVALLLPSAAKTGLADTPVIDSIVTNDLTGRSEGWLISGHGRSVLEHEILGDINAQTNQVVSRVYFTQLAVQ